MAETWIANAQAVTYAAAKDMFDIFNTNSSTKTIKLYRAHLFNNQTSAVTGVLNTLNLFLCTAAPTSGTTVTPVKMDTANPSYRWTAAQERIPMMVEYRSASRMMNSSRPPDDTAAGRTSP